MPISFRVCTVSRLSQPWILFPIISRPAPTRTSLPSRGRRMECHAVQADDLVESDMLYSGESFYDIIGVVSSSGDDLACIHDIYQ